MGQDDDRAEDDDNVSIDNTTTFPLSAAGNAFLAAAFTKCMVKKTYENHIQKCRTPDYRWSKCPDLDAVVMANLPKDTVRMEGGSTID